MVRIRASISLSDIASDSRFTSSRAGTDVSVARRKGRAVEGRANSPDNDVAHPVPLQRPEHFLRLEARHSGRLWKGPRPVRALFESQHVEQALQPLPRWNRQHLRDLVLASHPLHPHALEPRIVGRHHRRRIGTHTLQGNTAQLRITDRSSPPRASSTRSTKPRKDLKCVQPLVGRSREPLRDQAPVVFLRVLVLATDGPQQILDLARDDRRGSVASRACRNAVSWDGWRLVTPQSYSGGDFQDREDRPEGQQPIDGCD